MAQSQNIEKYANPLEKIRDFNKEERNRINLALWKERETFLDKLRSKRHNRARLEARAAVVVQAAYRRYSIRRYWTTRKYALGQRIVIRERIWRILGGVDKTKWVLSQALNTARLKSDAAEARNFREAQAREQAAKQRTEKEKAEREALELQERLEDILKAQRAKFSFNIADKKRIELEELNRKNMASAIQACCRRFLASRRISLRRNRLHFIAAVMIQSMRRVALSRRKVGARRNLAAEKRRAECFEL